MKRIFLLLLFVLSIGIVSATSLVTVTYRSPTVPLTAGEGFIQGNIFGDISPTLFTSWRCSTSAIPSVIYIGDTCFCVDTQLGVGTADGYGYGNILQCLRENPEIRVVHPSQSSSGLTVNISLTYQNMTAVDFGPVEISPLLIARDDTISCSAEEFFGYDAIYTFYRERPFGILYRGFSSEITLSDSRLPIQSGDSIRCHIQLYDRGQLVSHATSLIATVDDQKVGINSLYIAPAHPRVNDPLHCYGNPHIDTVVTENVIQKFIFYDSNGIELARSETESSTAVFASYISEERGVITCVYEVEYEETIISQSIEAMVRLPRPERPIVSLDIE